MRGNQVRMIIAAAAMAAVTVAGALVAAPGVAASAADSSAGPRTSRAADPGAVAGKYRGKAQGHYRVTFKVKPGARRLVNFSTSVVAYYRGPLGSNPQVVRVAFASTKLTPNGRFAHTYRRVISSDGSVLTVRVRGNINRGRLTDGKITYFHDGDGYEVRTDGPQPFNARRK